MSSGYIMLHRKLEGNFLYTENRVFSKCEAWIDMLLKVQWNPEPQEIMIGMDVLTCNRGESLKSLVTWGDRWNWSKSKVSRFFVLLKKKGMIEVSSEVKTTRITICNFDTYNDPRNANKTQVKRKQNASKTQVDTDNKVKKGNKVNKVNKKEEYESFFDEFWAEYPVCENRTNEQGALKKFIALKPTRELLDKMLRSLKVWKKTDKWQKGFILAPNRWLKERCWEDEIKTQTPSRPTHTPTAQPVSVNPDLSNQQKNHIVEDYHEHLAKLDINFHSQIRSQPNFFKRAAYKALNTYPKDVLDKEIYNHTGCVNSWDDIERALKTSDSQLKLAN